MLSKADDYLLHQTPDTFDRVFTSDRNFYDRYYFNLHACSDELFAVVGMGQYPNLGVTDAFVTISHRDKQYTVRASRELGADRLDTSVGPLRIEVIEGLRRFRVICEPAELGIELDLTWEGGIPPVEEPQFFQRSFARIVSQGSRLMQTGFWSGSLKVAGETYQVTPDHWWGIRDHSWGIRGVGDPEAPGIRAKLAAAQGFFWNWAPMQFKDFSFHYLAQEDAAGKRSSEEAVKAFPYAAGKEPEHLGTPRHKMQFVSGTRQMAAGTVTFVQTSGQDVVVKVTPLRNVHLMAGTGYGGGDGWRHGVYQGALKVEGLTYDLADPSVLRKISGFNEMLCAFDLAGERGYGMYEHIINGIYRPYGFDTPAAVAP
jgi:hypothetical protein